MRAVPLVAALCAALLGSGGCDMINDAAAPIDRDRLIEDVVEQLQSGEEIRYQATYQLSGGNRARVSQRIKPDRIAYAYPDGLLVLGEQERTACDLAVKPPKCEISILQRASGGLPGGFTDLAEHGMMAGPVVADLLRAASLQPTTTVKPHDTTIAGVPASCLEVYGLADAAATDFTVCVTADGVLASFVGVVDGTSVDLALVKLELKDPPAAEFDVPEGANVVDLRQS